MNYLKKIGISLLYIIGIIVVATFVVSIFNYFNIINGKALTISKILICFISLFMGGFVIGKKASKKGWLEGLKLGAIFLVLLILFNYLGLRNTPQIKNVIYYLIMMASCIFGSIIGINRKVDNS